MARLLQQKPDVNLPVARKIIVDKFIFELSKFNNA
jgi:hypothetical protein